MIYYIYGKSGFDYQNSLKCSIIGFYAPGGGGVGLSKFVIENTIYEDLRA